MHKILLAVLYSSIIFIGVMAALVVAFAPSDDVVSKIIGTLFLIVLVDILVLISMLSPYLWLKAASWTASFFALISSMISIWFINDNSIAYDDSNYDPYSYIQPSLDSFATYFSLGAFLLALALTCAALYSMINRFSQRTQALKISYWTTLIYGIFTGITIFIAAALYGVSYETLFIRFAVANSIIFATIFFVNIILIISHLLYGTISQHKVSQRPFNHPPQNVPVHNNAQPLPMKNDVPVNLIKPESLVNPEYAPHKSIQDNFPDYTKNQQVQAHNNKPRNWIVD